MKDLKRSARNLNTLLNIVFWLLVARGLYAAVFHGITLYRIFTDSAAILSGKMGLTIDYLTLEAAGGFGIDLDAAVSMKLVQLLSAVVITVIGCLAVRCLKRILLPIEVGEPFRRGIGGNVQKLAQLCLALGLAENLVMLFCEILIQNHYGLQELLVNETVTKVTIAPQFRPAWFFVAAVLTILSMVFRQGEELQTLADETL